MPKLSIPFLPLHLGEKGLEKFKSTLVTSKGFRGSSLTRHSLSLHPFYLFELQIFKSDDGIVSSEETKIILLDSADFTVSEHSPEFFKSVIENANNSEPPNLKLNILKPKSSYKTMKKIALIKSSKLFNVPKPNLLIIKEKPFFLPIWNLTINLKDTDYYVKINAFSKEIIFENIPKKEKEFNDLFLEVISDLTNPKTWNTYLESLPPPSKEKFIVKKPSNKPPSPMDFLEHHYMQLIILLIILIILMYSFFYL